MKKLICFSWLTMKKISNNVSNSNFEFENSTFIIFTLDSKIVLCLTLFLSNENNIDLWHQRLGHPGSKTIEQICRIFSFVHSISKIACDTCHFSKQNKLPFWQSNTHSLNVFNLIHVDIQGPIGIASIHGHMYFLTIVDDHIRHT